MDYTNAVLDEIALEGLDGITLPSLWVRLEARPGFKLSLDTGSQQYIWQNIILKNDELRFYFLEHGRDTLILHNRFSTTDPDTGIVVESDGDLPELYPINIVNDTNSGVMGSCATYNSRKDVTKLVKKENYSVKDLEEMYSSQFVVVASQEQRYVALVGRERNISIDLTDRCYCILERIGRARYHGEITQGKNSLSIFGMDNKTIFYMKKKLKDVGLITSQVFNIRLANKNNTTGRLLHLKRFYVERMPLYLGCLENLCQKLSEKPEQRELLTVIRDEMGMKDKSFKKLYQLGQGFVETKLVPFRDVYPDATPREYLTKSTISKLTYSENHKERMVRLMVLKKKYVYKRDGEEDSDEEVDGGMDTKNQAPHRRLYYERAMNREVYTYLDECEGKGVSLASIASTYGLTKLDARSIARNFERLQVAEKIMVDINRQRVHTYVATPHVETSILMNKLAKEKQRIEEKRPAKKERVETVVNDGEDPMDMPILSPLPADSALNQSISEGEAGETDGDDALKLDLKDVLLDSNLHLMPSNHKKTNAHVTYRMLKRANLILEAVKQAKLVDNLFLLQKRIIDEEIEEGYRYKIDKKSMIRLIERLARGGQLQSIKTMVDVGGEMKQLHFVCDNSLQSDDPLIKSAIEAAKHKELAIKKTHIARDKKIEPADMEKIAAIPSDPQMPNYALLKSNVRTSDMEYDSEMGKRYGFLPRMKRIEVIHHYMWYLAYGYGQTMESVPTISSLESGSVGSIHPHDPQHKPAERKLDADPYAVGEDVIDDSTLKVYAEELSWRRFIPPLSKHLGYPPGWLLVGDAMLNIPVAMFCQICRVNFRIPFLLEYLCDPVKQFIPICYLPTTMRQQLLHERKYIHSFSEICTNLCQLGLMSKGLQTLKEKHQVFMYVHKYGSLVDTTANPEKLDHHLGITDENEMTAIELLQKTGQEVNSEDGMSDNSNQSSQDSPEKGHTLPYPGPKRNFEFLTMKDVNKYWFTLQWISFNTPLDRFVSKPDNERSMCKGDVKPPRFEKCLSGKNPEEIVDVGEIPGDGLGVAGIDSVFWAHLRRNWTYCVDDVKVMSLRDPIHRSTDFSWSQSQVTSHALFRMREDQARNERDERLKKQREDRDKKRAIRSRQMKNDEDKNKELVDDPSYRPSKSGRKSRKKGQLTEDDVEKVIVKAGSRGKGGKGSKKRKYPLPDEEQTQLGRVNKRRKKEKPEVLPEGTGGQRYRRGYDKVDYTALEKMTRERVDWTPQEDSFLLLCQVAAVFLTGDRRDMLIPWHFIRDMLHEHISASQDKTSKACARRRTYMLKHHTTRTNVDVFVGEALQDPQLVREFKTAQKYIKTMVEENVIRFKALLSKLRDKFSGTLEPQKINLPDSMDELQRRFIIRVHPTPKTPIIPLCGPNLKETDIYSSVLHNLIHSSMMLSDKTGRAHELYQLFNQYPEPILMAVFSQMKEAGIITKIKKYKRKQQGLGTVPASMGSYQVAQRYMYHWFSKYPTKLCEHIHQLLAPLNSAGANVALTMEETGAFSATVVSLMAQKQICFETTIPEKVIVVDTTKVRAAANKKHKTDKPTESDEEEEALIEEAEKARAARTGAKSTVEDGKPTFTCQQASRVMLSVARCTTNHQVSLRLLEPNENIAINSCSVKVKLRPDLREQNAIIMQWPTEFATLKGIKKWNKEKLWVHPKTGIRILKHLRHLQPPKVDIEEAFSRCEEEFGFDNQDKEMMRKLYETVKEHKVNGITGRQLKLAFPSVENLSWFLDIAIEFNMILRVGINEFVYVTFEFARPWLIYSYKNVKGRGTGHSLSRVAEAEDLIDLGSNVKLPAYLPEQNTLNEKDRQVSFPVSDDVALATGKDSSILVERSSEAVKETVAGSSQAERANEENEINDDAKVVVLPVKQNEADFSKSLVTSTCNDQQQNAEQDQPKQVAETEASTEPAGKDLPVHQVTDAKGRAGEEIPLVMEVDNVENNIEEFSQDGKEIISKLRSSRVKSSDLKSSKMEPPSIPPPRLRTRSLRSSCRTPVSDHEEIASGAAKNSETAEKVQLRSRSRASILDTSSESVDIFEEKQRTRRYSTRSRVEETDNESEVPSNSSTPIKTSEPKQHLSKRKRLSSGSSAVSVSKRKKTDDIQHSLFEADETITVEKYQESNFSSLEDAMAHLNALTRQSDNQPTELVNIMKSPQSIRSPKRASTREYEDDLDVDSDEHEDAITVQRREQIPDQPKSKLDKEESEKFFTKISVLTEGSAIEQHESSESEEEEILPPDEEEEGVSDNEDDELLSDGQSTDNELDLIKIKKEQEQLSILAEVGAFELLENSDKPVSTSHLMMMESSCIELLRPDSNSDEDLETTFNDLVSQGRTDTPASSWVRRLATPSSSRLKTTPSSLLARNVETPKIKEEKEEQPLIEPKQEPEQEEPMKRSPPVSRPCSVQRLVLGSDIQRNRLNLSGSITPRRWASEVLVPPLTPRTSLTQSGIRVRLPAQHRTNHPATPPTPGYSTSQQSAYIYPAPPPSYANSAFRPIHKPKPMLPPSHPPSAFRAPAPPPPRFNTPTSACFPTPTSQYYSTRRPLSMDHLMHDSQRLQMSNALSSSSERHAPSGNLYASAPSSLRGSLSNFHDGSSNLLHKSSASIAQNKTCQDEAEHAHEMQHKNSLPGELNIASSSHSSKTAQSMANKYQSPLVTKILPPKSEEQQSRESFSGTHPQIITHSLSPLQRPQQPPSRPPQAPSQAPSSVFEKVSIGHESKFSHTSLPIAGLQHRQQLVKDSHDIRSDQQTHYGRQLYSPEPSEPELGFEGFEDRMFNDEEHEEVTYKNDALLHYQQQKEKEEDEKRRQHALRLSIEREQEIQKQKQIAGERKALERQQREQYERKRREELEKERRDLEERRRRDLEERRRRDLEERQRRDLEERRRRDLEERQRRDLEEQQCRDLEERQKKIALEQQLEQERKSLEDTYREKQKQLEKEFLIEQQRHQEQKELLLKQQSKQEEESLMKLQQEIYEKQQRTILKNKLIIQQQELQKQQRQIMQAEQQNISEQHSQYHPEEILDQELPESEEHLHKQYHPVQEMDQKAQKPVKYVFVKDAASGQFVKTPVADIKDNHVVLGQPENHQKQGQLVRRELLDFPKNRPITPMRQEVDPRRKIKIVYTRLSSGTLLAEEYVESKMSTSEGRYVQVRSKINLKETSQENQKESGHMQQNLVSQQNHMHQLNQSTSSQSAPQVHRLTPHHRTVYVPRSSHNQSLRCLPNEPNVSSDVFNSIGSVLNESDERLQSNRDEFSQQLTDTRHKQTLDSKVKSYEPASRNEISDSMVMDAIRNSASSSNVRPGLTFEGTMSYQQDRQIPAYSQTLNTSSTNKGQAVSASQGVLTSELSSQYNRGSNHLFVAPETYNAGTTGSPQHTHSRGIQEQYVIGQSGGLKAYNMNSSSGTSDMNMQSLQYTLAQSKIQPPPPVQRSLPSDMIVPSTLNYQFANHESSGTGGAYSNRILLQSPTPAKTIQIVSMSTPMLISQQTTKERVKYTLTEKKRLDRERKRREVQNVLASNPKAPAASTDRATLFQSPFSGQPLAQSPVPTGVKRPGFVTPQPSPRFVPPASPVVTSLMVRSDDELQKQIKQIMSGASGPVQFKLPPGMALPFPGGEKVKVVSESDAAKLGIMRPGSATPGRITPARVIPGRMTPGRVTPGRMTPGQVTPGRKTPGKAIPGMITPGRATPKLSTVSRRLNTTARLSSTPVHFRDVSSSTAHNAGKDDVLQALQQVRKEDIQKEINQSNTSRNSARSSNKRGSCEKQSSSGTVLLPDQASMDYNQKVMNYLAQNPVGAQFDGPADEKPSGTRKTRAASQGDTNSADVSAQIRTRRMSQRIKEVKQINTVSASQAALEIASRRPSSVVIENTAKPMMKFNNVSRQDISEDMGLLLTPAHHPQRTVPDMRGIESELCTSGINIIEHAGTYQRVHLIIRPWKTPEGTVNRPTLKMMLSAVMTFIMTHPGVTKKGLENKYEQVLQPVPLLELVEMLEILGCVKIVQAKMASKPSLFSERVKAVEICDELLTEHMSFLPTVDCLIKFGQFENHLKGPSNG